MSAVKCVLLIAFVAIVLVLKWRRHQRWRAWATAGDMESLRNHFRVRFSIGGIACVLFFVVLAPLEYRTLAVIVLLLGVANLILAIWPDLMVKMVVSIYGRRCERCGHILTGNLSGVCPECGTAIEQPESKP